MRGVGSQTWTKKEELFLVRCPGQLSRLNLNHNRRNQPRASRDQRSDALSLRTSRLEPASIHVAQDADELAGIHRLNVIMHRAELFGGVLVHFCR